MQRVAVDRTLHVYVLHLAMAPLAVMSTLHMYFTSWGTDSEAADVGQQPSLAVIGLLLCGFCMEGGAMISVLA